MLLDNVKAVLLDYCGLKPTQKIIAGVSGGVDSIVLLDVLTRTGLVVIVAHMDHQLRPSSAQEAKFVGKTAQRYGLEFISKREDVSALAATLGESLEEAARNARYRFLFDTAEEKGAAAVLVAHQADDQVETVLMNLLRGTGLNGLAGMQYRSISAYHPVLPLIRPLLDCWREDIVAYSQQEKLEHVTDESNQDTTYKRNRVRLELIPELEAYNPKLKESLLRMAKILGEDKNFLDAFISDTAQQVCLKSENEYAVIDIQRFKKYPAAVQRYLVRWILSNHFPNEKDFGAVQFEQARRLIARETLVLNSQLNHHVLVRVEDDQAVFMTVEYSEHADEKWPNLEQEMRVNRAAGRYKLGLGWVLESHILNRMDIEDEYKQNPDNYMAYLDLDKLSPELDLRVWQAGDRYHPLGMQGESIKLSDFWIDRKIPRRAKKFWPLVFSEEELVWIPGFQPSHKACISDETRRILHMHVFKAED